MPLHKLSAAEITRLSQKATPTKAANPFTSTIKSLKVGEGARADVAEEGLTRQGLKLKITKAAKAAGVTIKYLRSGADAVIFTVVEKGTSS